VISHSGLWGKNISVPPTDSPQAEELKSISHQDETFLKGVESSSPTAASGQRANN